MSDNNWTPLNPDHWIDPGTETDQQITENVLCLALTIEGHEQALNNHELTGGFSPASRFDQHCSAQTAAAQALTLEIIANRHLFEAVTKDA